MKSKEINPIHGLNGQMMVTGAHRYFLGRSSYGVGCCMEWLTLWWKEFDTNARNVIIRDTVEFLQDDNGAGNKNDFDHQRWKQFAEWAWNSEEVSDEDCLWVKQAVAHRNKPWPLNVGG